MTNPLILAFDVDGVLANFNDAYAKRLAKVTGNNRLPSDWQPVTWNWDVHYGYTDKEIGDTIQNITNDRLFWQKLKPIDEVVLSRIGVLSRSNPVYFLTNRFGIRCKQGTEKFLYEYGVSYPTVIICKDKLPVLKAIGADFFIDDKLETMNEVSDALDTEHLYLIDAPYNRDGRSEGLKTASSAQDALEKAGLW